MDLFKHIRNDWNKEYFILFFNFSCDLYLLELSKSGFFKDRENKRIYHNRMGLVLEISLNICAHFEPITCYQDHTENGKNLLFDFRMRYRVVLLVEAQYFENGEIHYRSIAEIEIGQIAPLDVRGMRSAQQQQPLQLAEQQQPQATAACSPSPQSPPAQVSPLRRRRRDHPYRPPAIIPVPPRTDKTSPPSPDILPVPRPSRQRQTARMSTSQLPRILQQ